MKFYVVLCCIMTYSICSFLGCGEKTSCPRPMPTAMPDDLHVEAVYSGATVSPPHHYSYTIELGQISPDSIRFAVDYGPYVLGETLWIESFDATQSDLERLYTRMYDNDIFRNNWDVFEDHPVGGSSRRLTIIAHSRQFAVPWWVRDESSVEPVYALIDSLVPAALWDSLWARRERHIQGG
ncbi:MAG: hypothetical protein KAY32_17420 [Candidatus Eisenbacteria sp.]|nr:hypothetical protein [Candidatus Eisenbacteria bacterium]